MDRIRGGDAIPTIHAEIIPPQPGAASISRSSHVIDVYPELLAAPRRNETPKGPVRKRRVAPFLWAGVIIALILTALLALRGPIVDWLPGTAGIYNAIGVPVAPTSPTLEGVSVIRIYSRGSTVLTVEGNIANETGRQLTLPPVTLIMLDANATTLGTMAITPASTRLDPNGRTRFSTDIADPPAILAALAVQIGDEAPVPILID